MDTGWGLLIDIMATLAGAFLLGALMERFRLSAILGYILAGVILGPGMAGVVRSSEAVEGIAELGVALLLFSIGLEISWKQVLKLGPIGLGGGSLQVLGTMAATFALSMAAGMRWEAGLALGAVVALSSTVVVTKALKEQGDLDASHGKACLGILVFQDLAFIPLVLLLTGLGGEFQQAVSLEDFGSAAAQLLIGLIVIVLIVVAFLPRAMRSRALARNRELPILLAITICIGSAWAAHWVGMSPAMGAFLGGVILSETAYADQIRADVGPLRTLFATVFFASVGMLADGGWIVKNVGTVLAVTAAIVFGKSVLAFVAARAFRMTTIAAIAAGLCLAQVGELSFVLLQVGMNRDLISAQWGQILTSASVFTLALSPMLVRVAPDWGRAVAKWLVPARKLAREQSEARKGTKKVSGHVVVVGFGEAGRSAAQTLRRLGRSVLVLETDRKLVGAVQAAGCRSLLGDATQAEILEHAHLATAAGLVVAVSDHRTARMTVSQARAVQPNIPIVARSRYHTFRDEIATAGADRVIDEETLVGRRLAEEVALQIGLLWDHEGRDR
jgi:monovalent cation:H+ antiporter-2, CPA2 family